MIFSRRTDISRRTFLGSSLAAAAGHLLGARPARANVAQQPRVALIGCGRHGRALAQTWHQAHPGALACVCDTDHAAAEALAAETGATPLREWQQALDAREINAVAIATTDALHLPMALAALNAGKRVYLETPLVGPADELCELAAADRQERVTVGLDFAIAAPLMALDTHAQEAGWGMPRYAQFHVRVQPRAKRDNCAHSFEPVLSSLYQRAMAYHLSIPGLADPVELTLQRANDSAEQAVLTLHYPGGQAVFIASAANLAAQNDIVRYAHGAGELAGDAVQIHGAEKYLQRLAKSPSALWLDHLSDDAPARHGLAGALPLHEAFVKALA